MMSIINKLITLILVPLFMSPALPFLQVAKLVYPEKEVISLSENGIGTAEDPVYLTAHRGVTAVAPENTIPAYEAAVRLGFYTAECDIQLTADGVWVLNHNSDTDNMFCQYGEIAELTYEELCTFSYKKGANFWKYENLKIATLDEFLDVFVGTATRPQIEIKADGYDQLYTILEAVYEKDLQDSAIIISFDYEQLKAIRELDKDIELWYLIDDINADNIAQAKALGGNVWLSPDFEDNTQESIQLAIDAGVPTSFWTVNDLEDAKMLYDMGIRYIETDIFCN